MTIAVALALVTADAARPVAQQAPPPATWYRIFLRDGSTLVSFGEYARVANRLVLSLPLDGQLASPTLQLVSIPADSVDWTRTNAYAEAARAARYADTRGADDYAMLTQQVAAALNQIALTDDPSRRLSMAVEARRNLAQWPAQHFGYRAADVAQLAGMFDEVISGLRAQTGQGRFELSLVANTGGPPPVPLMPPPTAEEAAAQALHAAALTGDAAERTTLLRAIATALAPAADGGWAARIRSRAEAALREEERIDADYAALTRDALREADARAREADVRGVQRAIGRALKADDRLGRRRPHESAALMAALDARLAAARRFRLERDRWEARRAALARYEKLIEEPSNVLREAREPLEDIRRLSGPSPRTLARLHARVSVASRLLALVQPPEDARTAYSLLRDAFRMAERAATVRQKAVASADLRVAWDASSAAAAALMLFDRATAELEALARPPEFE
ncbi:MAG TPA: hypothetical protein VFK20_07950 [Vicinamibacterales bacterium]|nr:hypothetical protein [Vicinamibacterales bacterium]